MIIKCSFNTRFYAEKEEHKTFAPIRSWMGNFWWNKEQKSNISVEETRIISEPRECFFPRKEP